MLKRRKMFDLGFGRTDCVKSALDQFYNVSGFADFTKLDYPSDNDIKKLEELTKQRMFELYGKEYKHVSITAGAMNALDIICRLKNVGTLYVNEDCFSYYNALPCSLMRRVDMLAISTNVLIDNEDMAIIDSPNNPTGRHARAVFAGGDVVWDAVYHNKVYSHITMPVFSEHMVGSFGKLFGLSGLRLGFVGTNNIAMKLTIDEMVEKNQCSLNSISISIITNLLERNLTSFLEKAQSNVDVNRDIMSSLTHIFADSVPDDGMFYYPYADYKLKNLLDDSGIKYIDGTYIGDIGRVRLNLCVNRGVLKNAVNKIIQNDRRK